MCHSICKISFLTKERKKRERLAFIVLIRFFSFFSLQTDYFCTLCESYLKEEELQSHLFEGHQAENVEESFVRVKNSAKNGGSGGGGASQLHICVVCWAKIPRVGTGGGGGGGGREDLRAHRAGCRTDPAEDDLENGAVPMESGKGAGVSGAGTPDIANLLSTVAAANAAANGDRRAASASAAASATSPAAARPGGGGSGGAGSGAGAGASLSGAPSLSLTPLGPRRGPRKRAQPAPHSSLVPPPAPLPSAAPPPSSSSSPSPMVNGLSAAAAAAGGVLAQQSVLAGLAAQAAHRLQCSLCSMVVPSPGYLVHLRDFHRVTCPLEDLTCPLCLSPVPVLELSLHLTAVHSAAPVAAVNSIMVSTVTSREIFSMPKSPNLGRFLILRHKNARPT